MDLVDNKYKYPSSMWSKKKGYMARKIGTKGKGEQNRTERDGRL
jgi:hypothetical protein